MGLGSNDNKIMINNTSSISVAGQKIRPPGRNIPNDSHGLYLESAPRALLWSVAAAGNNNNNNIEEDGT